MKITGAEFIEWYDRSWPFESEDWYHENGEIPTHRESDGAWALDPSATYDTEDLGSVHYQGRGEDPTHGEGYSVTSLVKAWRKTRDFEVVTVLVPKARAAEIRAELARLGVRVA